MRNNQNIATAIGEGADYVQLLYEVELAFALSDLDRVESLLAGIDPIECGATAALLKVLATALRDEPTETRPSSNASEELPGASATAAPPSGQSSSRITFHTEPPKHPGWSIRCQ